MTWLVGACLAVFLVVLVECARSVLDGNSTAIIGVALMAFSIGWVGGRLQQ